MLAESMLVTSGAITARVIRLEEAGLVVRIPDPADGRAVLVRLTAQGEMKAVAALHAVLEADEAVLEPLSHADRDTMAALLKALLQYLERG